MGVSDQGCWQVREGTTQEWAVAWMVASVHSNWSDRVLSYLLR